MKTFSALLVAAFVLSFGAVSHSFLSQSSADSPQIELAKKNKKKNNKNRNNNRTTKSKITSKGLTPEGQLGGADADAKMRELTRGGQAALNGYKPTDGAAAAAAALEQMKKDRSVGLKNPMEKSGKKKK